MLRLRNRFSVDEMRAETQLLGGYRDIGLKLQVGFAMMPNGEVRFIPCCQWSDKSFKFKVIFFSFALESFTAAAAPFKKLN
jgi:hypothetical protein